MDSEEEPTHPVMRLTAWEGPALNYRVFFFLKQCFLIFPLWAGYIKNRYKPMKRGEADG